MELGIADLNRGRNGPFCHCEERSDEAISLIQARTTRLLRPKGAPSGLRSQWQISHVNISRTTNCTQNYILPGTPLGETLSSVLPEGAGPLRASASEKNLQIGPVRGQLWQFFSLADAERVRPGGKTLERVSPRGVPGITITFPQKHHLSECPLVQKVENDRNSDLFYDFL